MKDRPRQMSRFQAIVTAKNLFWSGVMKSENPKVNVQHGLRSTVGFVTLSAVI